MEGLFVGQVIFQLVNNHFNKFYILGIEKDEIFVETNPKSKKRGNNIIKIFSINELNKTLFLEKKGGVQNEYRRNDKTCFFKI